MGGNAPMGTEIGSEVRGGTPLGSIKVSVHERGRSKFEGHQKVRHNDLLSNFSKWTGLDPSGTFDLHPPIVRYGARKQLTR